MEFETKTDKVVDIAKGIIFFLLTTVIAFAWFMLMLLIISFVTSHYLHFTIEGIFIASIVGTVGVDIWYVVKKVRGEKPPRRKKRVDAEGK